LKSFRDRELAAEKVSDSLTRLLRRDQSIMRVDASHELNGKGDLPSELKLALRQQNPCPTYLEIYEAQLTICK
jgi:hypothetical protein